MVEIALERKYFLLCLGLPNIRQWQKKVAMKMFENYPSSDLMTKGLSVNPGMSSLCPLADKKSFIKTKRIPNKLV